jgi:hypothetical protein
LFHFMFLVIAISITLLGLCLYCMSLFHIHWIFNKNVTRVTGTYINVGVTIVHIVNLYFIAIWLNPYLAVSFEETVYSNVGIGLTVLNTYLVAVGFIQYMMFRPLSGFSTKLVDA